jgi:hypothetical protein
MDSKQILLNFLLIVIMKQWSNLCEDSERKLHSVHL